MTELPQLLPLLATKMTLETLNTGVEITIVDWDTSHCLYEKEYFDTIKVILSERYYYGQPAPFGIEHDLLYLSVYEMEIEECDHEY